MEEKTNKNVMFGLVLLLVIIILIVSYVLYLYTVPLGFTP